MKELHLYLDDSKCDSILYTTYMDTLNALMDTNGAVHTTIPHFLRWNYANRLFVHVGNSVHEITLGVCDGTDKEVRECHNIEKMLLNCAFDWFRGDD